MPGSHFIYSDLNFVVAATIIESISKQRFDHYINNNILANLHVVGSSFNINDFS